MAGWQIALLVGGGVGLVAAVVIALRRSIKRDLEAWSAFAQSVGLEHTPGRFVIHGTHNGIPVQIDTVRRRSPFLLNKTAHNNNTYTRFRATPRVPVPRDMNLHAHVPDSYVSYYSLTKTEVGDPEFDNAIYVAGANPPEVVAFLGSAETRRAILHWVTGDTGLNPFSRVYISEGSVLVFCYLVLVNGDELKRALQVVSKFASDIEQAQQQSFGNTSEL